MEFFRRSKGKRRPGAAHLVPRLGKKKGGGNGATFVYKKGENPSAEWDAVMVFDFRPRDRGQAGEGKKRRDGSFPIIIERNLKLLSGHPFREEEGDGEGPSFSPFRTGGRASPRTARPTASSIPGGGKEGLCWFSENEGDGKKKSAGVSRA